MQFGPHETPFQHRPPPMTGAERQAAFRERHPDRVDAYNAQRRARRLAIKAKIAEQALLARQQATAAQTLPAPPVRLALPAPAPEPLFILPVETRELVPVHAAEREERQQRRAA